MNPSDQISGSALVTARVVILGHTEVGKTAILTQFLDNSFKDKHRPTIDDLISRTFLIENSKLKVDFLDTSGDDEFPAMRKLSIKSGHCFLLVYSVTSALSLEVVKLRLQEIVDTKENPEQVPIVIVGNKSDSEAKREVNFRQVKSWIDEEYKDFQIAAIECSALTRANINKVFKHLMELSKIQDVVENLNLINLKKSNSLRRASAGIPTLHLKPEKSFRGLRSYSTADKDSSLLSPKSISPSFLAAMLSPRCSRRSMASKSPSPSPSPRSPLASKSPSPSPKSPLASNNTSPPTTDSNLIFDFNINNIKIKNEPCFEDIPKGLNIDIQPLCVGKINSRSRSLNRERKTLKKQKNVIDVQDCVLS